MRKILLVFLVVSMFSQGLWAITPKQYLELSDEGEKIARENARNFSICLGMPIMLGGLLVENASLKTTMLGLGGFFTGWGLLYDSLQFPSEAEKMYRLNKNNLDDTIAIEILKKRKDELVFTRRMISALSFTACLFNYESANNNLSASDDNIYMKSVLISSGILMWFVPTAREKMIDAVIKGEIETSGLNLIPLNRGLAISYQYSQ